MTQKLPKEKNNVYNLTKKTKIVGVIKPAQNLLTNKRRTKNWANFASLLQENKGTLFALVCVQNGAETKPIRCTLHKSFENVPYSIRFTKKNNNIT